MISTSAQILKYTIVILSLLNSSYMCYDGARALIKGDYIRPKQGEYAGQLGPWTRLVESIGIDPMSVTMKSIFLIFGIVGLLITISFIVNAQTAWKALLIFNVCCLWNLYFGSVSCLLQIVLLVLMRVLK